MAGCPEAFSAYKQQRPSATTPARQPAAPGAACMLHSWSAQLRWCMHLSPADEQWPVRLQPSSIGKDDRRFMQFQGFDSRLLSHVIAPPWQTLIEAAMCCRGRGQSSQRQTPPQQRHSQAAWCRPSLPAQCLAFSSAGCPNEHRQAACKFMPRPAAEASHDQHHNP